MFKLTVVSSDAFTSMTLSAQALYFHLNLRADDDGFIDSPLRIMREIGANQGDMEQLLKKRYLIYYESGVIVVKHWRLHNTIRKDRYNPTLYQEEYAQLEEKESGVYTEVYKSSQIDNDDWQPNGNQMAHRLDKSRVDKISIEESKELKTACPSSKIKNPQSSKQKYGEYKHVMLTDAEVSKLQADFGNVEELIKHLDEYMEISGRKYKNCNLVIRRWVVDAVKEKNQTKNKHVATARTVSTPEYSTDDSIDADVDELKNSLKDLLGGNKE